MVGGMLCKSDKPSIIIIIIIVIVIVIVIIIITVLRNCNPIKLNIILCRAAEFYFRPLLQGKGPARKVGG